MAILVTLKPFIEDLFYHFYVCTFKMSFITFLPKTLLDMSFSIHECGYISCLEVFYLKMHFSVIRIIAHYLLRKYFLIYFNVILLSVWLIFFTFIPSLFIHCIWYLLNISFNSKYFYHTYFLYTYKQEKMYLSRWSTAYTLTEDKKKYNYLM